MTALLEIACKKVISDPDVAPPIPLHQEQIAEMVEILSRCEQPEMPVTHRFSPGIYCREIFMPADTYVVGHKHKTRHQNIVLSGSAIVTIDGVSQTITAPFVFESGEGAQKLLRIVEDMRWMTVHANPDNITDIPTIEDLIFDLPQDIKESGLELDQFRMNRNLQLKEESP